MIPLYRPYTQDKPSQVIFLDMVSSSLADIKIVATCFVQMFSQRIEIGLKSFGLSRE